MTTVYVVEDGMGYICVCATRELAKEYSEIYWCSYTWTEIVDENYKEPDVPIIHDLLREPE